MRSRLDTLQVIAAELDMAAVEEHTRCACFPRFVTNSPP
jgi:hypothetical protein